MAGQMKACMDPDDEADWEALNNRLPAVDMRAKSPCEDCTVRYAVEMRLLGRCDGWPGDRPEGRPWKRGGDERLQTRRSQWRDAKQRQRILARSRNRGHNGGVGLAAGVTTPSRPARTSCSGEIQW